MLKIQKIKLKFDHHSKKRKTTMIHMTQPWLLNPYRAFNTRGRWGGRGALEGSLGKGRGAVPV